MTEIKSSSEMITTGHEAETAILYFSDSKYRFVSANC